MTQINAYLSFSGNCRDAMNFYKDSLGGELTIMEMKNMPADMPCPPGSENNVMHSELTTEAGVIMATDMDQPGGIKKGNDFSLTVICHSEEELNSKFNAVMRDGMVLVSPKMQFWGDIMGFGKDKFGTQWMFIYSPNQK